MEEQDVFPVHMEVSLIQSNGCISFTNQFVLHCRLPLNEGK